MGRDKEGHPRQIRRRRLSLLVLAAAGPLALLFAFTFYLFVVVIPPSAGRVVDAITGEPIGNVKLSLWISREGWGIHTEERDSTTTGSTGWFFLSGAFRHSFPLEGRPLYWLSVNQTEGGVKGSSENQVLYDPMSNRSDWPVGDKRYFPLNVRLDPEGCDRNWAATCVHKLIVWGSRIPLIPVLSDPSECKRIANPTLRENCRQLNTYRSAFVHVDTYEEVQKGKALCTEVDRAYYSKTCLEQLHLYMANPRTYVRPFVSQPNVPLPEGMFADRIVQVARIRQGCGQRENFTGQFWCSAGYGPGITNWLVGVTVDEWPAALTSSLPIKPNYTDYLQATVKDVDTPNGKIKLYEGPIYVCAYWISNTRVVHVLFYHRIPEQEQFISHYLAEFPSTLK